MSAGADEGRADEDKTDGNGRDQEIHIYSDTRAGDSAGDETVPAANGGSIIQDQSFDVELDSLKAAEPPAKESISETRVVSEEIIRQAAGSWTLNAVSYTHLDVYKRQRLGPSFYAAVKDCPEHTVFYMRIVLLQPVYQPVSYTHLSGYGRFRSGISRRLILHIP